MSKSLRVSDALFDAATLDGTALSRSAAQQVEHWARLGRALEKRGLSADSAIALLQDRPAATQDPWADKRSRQQRDLARLDAGLASQDDMAWVTADMARNAKILNGPY